MLLSLEKIINLFELDAISVNNKYYWTASLYILHQKPDLNQKIKISTYKKNGRDYINFKFNAVPINGVANYNV